MDEITLDEKTYVSSKQAAKITGYAKDYVGQLCREGRVEARLVGRNWYVLESSIRDHRFGSEDKTPTKIAEESEKQTPSWSPASYTVETPSEEIPLVISYPERPKINIVEGRNPAASPIQPEIEPVSSKVVKEMQSAWHDWFAKTNELSVSEEILLENSPNLVSFQSEPSNLTPETQHEPETTPITLEKVTELIEEKEDNRASVVEEEEVEEVVPIHKTFSSPTQTPSNSYERPVSTPIRRLGASREAFSHTYPRLPSEGRILRNRPVLRKKKPNFLLQFIFIVLGVAAIGVTIIGSGVADPILSKYGIQTSQINYLVGESSVNK